MKKKTKKIIVKKPTRKPAEKPKQKKHFTLFGIIIMILGLVLFFYSFNTSLMAISAFITIFGALFFAISLMFPKEGNEDFFVFLDSFRKINVKYLYIILIDLIFMLSLYFLANSWNILVGASSEAYSGNVFYIALALLVLALIFVVLLLWSLFQGFDWVLISKASFTLKYYLNFLWLSTLLFLIWSIPIFFLLNYFAQTGSWPFYAIMIFAIILYYTLLAYVFFVKNHKVYLAISDAFVIGTRNAHLFLLPVLFVLFSFGVLEFVRIALAYLPETIFNVIYLMMFLLIIAWMRYYAVDIVEEMKRKRIK